MRTTAFIAATIAICWALAGCDELPNDLHGLEDEEAAFETTHLERAQEAGAEKYAPALYARAAERQEDELARLAISEALRVRDEARRTAHDKIREASVLLTVVEKIASHDPSGGASILGESELSRIRADLSRAEQAFERGDFAEAGILAQNATSALRGPRT